MTHVIAIDLDGTIARYDGWLGIENIGVPLKGAVGFVNDLVAMNYEVIIHTTRTNPEVNRGRSREELAVIVKNWLRTWGFNESVKVWAGEGKPLADAYVDDRAFLVETNSGFENDDAICLSMELEERRTK